MFDGFTDVEMVLLSQYLDRMTMNLTGETENIVNGEVFHDLHLQIGTLEHGKTDD